MPPRWPATCRRCAAACSTRESPPPREDDYLVYNYNRFQACRFGLDGIVVDPKTYEARPLREDILDSLTKLEHWPGASAVPQALEHLRAVVQNGSDADLLRQTFLRTGSPEGMVEAAIWQFRSYEST